MTTRTKSTFIIIGTFIIGVLIGALINGAVVRHRMNKIDKMRTVPGFSAEMQRIIKPSNDQLPKIEPILNRTAESLIQLGQRQFEHANVIVDSMVTDLNPYLTQEQKTRLQDHIRHFRKHVKKEHERHKSNQ